MRLSQHRPRASERGSSRKKSYADPEQQTRPCSRSVFVELLQAAAQIEKEMELQRQIIQDLGHKQSAEVLFDALYQLQHADSRRSVGIQIYQFEQFLQCCLPAVDKAMLRAWFCRFVGSWEGKTEVNLMMLRAYLQPREMYFLGRDQSLKSSECNPNEIENAFRHLLVLDINTGLQLEKLKILMAKYSPTLMFEEISGQSSITITPDNLSRFLASENQKLSQKTIMRALVRISANIRADRNFASEPNGVTLDEWRSFFAPRQLSRPSANTSYQKFSEEQSIQGNDAILEFLLQYVTSLQKIEDARCHLISREDFVPVALFNMADRNRLFFLTHEDLKVFFDKFCMYEQLTLTQGQMRFLLSAYDSDKDGVLNFEEFQDIFLPLDKIAKAQLLKRKTWPDSHSPARYSRETRGALIQVLKTVVLEEHNLEKLRLECNKTQLKELFRFIDVENRGKSGLKIIQEYFLKSGFEISHPQLRLLLLRLDSDFDRCLNLDEILREMKPHAPAYYRFDNY